MDHGDSFTHFFDLAQNELSKRPKAVSITRLQALLELALRHPGSTTSNDPVTEDLRAQLGDTTLTEWLTSVVLIDGNFVGRDDGLTSKAGSRNGSQPSASVRKTNPTIGEIVELQMDSLADFATFLRLGLLHSRLLREVSNFPRHLSQMHAQLSTHLPTSTTTQTIRARSD